MKLSRPVSWFLLAFGVWSWFIWITFVKNLWKDGSGLAFDDAGDPTAYFWVHLLLAVVSFVLGTVVGVIGLRGLRALRGELTPPTRRERRVMIVVFVVIALVVARRAGGVAHWYLWRRLVRDISAARGRSGAARARCSSSCCRC